MAAYLAKCFPSRSTALPVTAKEDKMRRISRRQVVVGFAALALAFLVAVPKVHAQAGTKGLKLRNQDARAVQYGLSRRGAAGPERTWVIQPGGSVAYNNFFTP